MACVDGTAASCGALLADPHPPIRERVQEIAVSLEELAEFEQKADEVAEGLPFWKLPVRSVLTAMYALIDQSIHGSLRGAAERHVANGETIAYRLSYLVPLLVRCSVDTIPTATEGMQQFAESDPKYEAARQLIAYSHFCELMPEARKGHYAVTRRTGGFDLAHPSAAFQDAETRDILLSELALGFEVEPPPRTDLRCGVLSGRIDVPEPIRAQFFGSVFADVLSELYEHAYRNLFEPLIFSDEGFRAAVGCGREEFLRFRAALIALARYGQQMCSWYRVPLQTGDRMQATADAYAEWVSVRWSDDFFFQLVRQMAGLSDDQVERLLSVYSIDVRAGSPDVSHARDGYFPPLWRLPGDVLFSPEVLGRFVSSRNLAFVLNRLDSRRFAELISEHLEPELVRTATDLLSSVRGVWCRPDIKWTSGARRGQIDLLVAFEGANVVWHVQAKGVLPPHGARMVRALEERVGEALDQLKVFRSLSVQERDRIITEGLGRIIGGVQVVDVVLLRSCAGTARVWTEKGNAVFLTLPLLAELTRQAQARNSVEPLVECGRATDSYLQALCRSVNPRWEMGKISLAGEEITMPLLKYDTAAVESERRRVWAGALLGVGRGVPWKVVAPSGTNVVVVAAGTLPPRPQTLEKQLIRVLRLMDHNPKWDDKSFGKSVGLHSKVLRTHPLTRAVLERLDGLRRAKGRTERGCKGV